jgi:phosphatidylglycerol---prolipoprotein diacylglyceryl transferase
MLPTIEMRNYIFSMYPVCVAFGFLTGSIIADIINQRYNRHIQNIFLLMCSAEIGLLIGGKLLFLLQNINKLPSIYRQFGFAGAVSKTGFVFYGGLICGIFFVYLYSRITRASFLNALSLILTVTPLIHAFGRIGCFCAGCCFGIPWNHFSAVFMDGAYRFPVQLLEAVCNIILFIFLFNEFKNNRKERIVFEYLTAYGIVRLICEQLRGDEIRGFLLHVSVSSWISLICIVTGIVIKYKIEKSGKSGNE